MVMLRAFVLCNKNKDEKTDNDIKASVNENICSLSNLCGNEKRNIESIVLLKIMYLCPFDSGM